MTITELITALEKCTGPSRELDAKIRLATNPTAISRDDEYSLRYTSSIDAALTLVPKSWRYGVCEMQRPTVPQPARFHGWVIPQNSCLADDELEGYSEATPAIALCIATLKARSAASK